MTAKTQPAVGDLLYQFRELADLDRGGDPVNTGLKLVVMTSIVVKVHKLFTILHCQRSDGKLGTRHRVSNAELLRLYSLTKSEAVMSSVEHCFATAANKRAQAARLDADAHRYLKFMKEQGL